MSWVSKVGPSPWIALLALSIILVIPLWYVLGFLSVAEEGAHGHGGEGGEAHEAKDEFLEIAEWYIKNYYDEERGCALPTEDNEVYVIAFTFGYRPNKICLEAGKHYTFKMMSTDVVHGASIATGDGSIMIRLPPGEIVEISLSFEEPGEYLGYCSFFCGIGHYNMAFKIIVEPSEVSEEEVEEHGH